MEQLTRDLIETHLLSYVEFRSEETRNGTRWAWCLSPMANASYGSEVAAHEWSFEYKSFEAARNYALKWLRENRKDLEAAAVQEARDGIRYRDAHKASA